MIKQIQNSWLREPAGCANSLKRREANAKHGRGDGTTTATCVLVLGLSSRKEWIKPCVTVYNVISDINLSWFYATNDHTHTCGKQKKELKLAHDSLRHPHHHDSNTCLLCGCSSRRIEVEKVTKLICFIN